MRTRVGVIGVGYLGQFHAEKYANSSDAELAGVVDHDQERARAVAGKLGCRIFDGIESLLAAVDAVSIAVPTVHHYGVAKHCLEKGKHVLLEKPMTVAVAEADDLVGLAEERNVVLQIGHIERFNPVVQVIQARAKAPRYLQAERSAPFTPRCTDVSVILDLMIHDIDVAVALAGARPVRLSAAGVSLITRDIDAASVRIEFANGCIADLSANRLSDEKKRLLRVYEAERCFLGDYQSQMVREVRRGEGDACGVVTRDLPTVRTDTLNEEVISFLRSVREGSAPVVPGREGRRALAIAQSIEDRIRSGSAGFVPVE